MYKELITQNYLSPGNNCSTETMRGIFAIRSHDLPIRGNFPGAHKELKCIIKDCSEKLETQIHLFHCPFLASGAVVTTCDICYSDIFGDNVSKQKKVMLIIKSRFEQRKEYIASSCKDSPHGPGGLRHGANLVIRKAKKSRKKIRTNTFLKLNKC